MTVSQSYVSIGCWLRLLACYVLYLLESCSFTLKALFKDFCLFVYRGTIRSLSCNTYSVFNCNVTYKRNEVPQSANLHYLLRPPYQNCAVCHSLLYQRRPHLFGSCAIPVMAESNRKINYYIKYKYACLYHLLYIDCN